MFSCRKSSTKTFSNFVSHCKLYRTIIKWFKAQFKKPEISRILKGKRESMLFPGLTLWGFSLMALSNVGFFRTTTKWLAEILNCFASCSENELLPAHKKLPLCCYKILDLEWHIWLEWNEKERIGINKRLRLKRYIR